MKTITLTDEQYNTLTEMLRRATDDANVDLDMVNDAASEADGVNVANAINSMLATVTYEYR